eukprot:Colp12_sorted_trinity150504_noHs@15676
MSFVRTVFRSLPRHSLAVTNGARMSGVMVQKRNAWTYGLELTQEEWEALKDYVPYLSPADAAERKALIKEVIDMSERDQTPDLVWLKKAFGVLMRQNDRVAVESLVSSMKACKVDLGDDLAKTVLPWLEKAKLAAYYED